MFAVGTRVICSLDITDYKMEVGTIIHIYDSEKLPYLIEFDNDIGGHDGFCEGVNGKPGHCWWISEDEFKVASSNIR